MSKLRIVFAAALLVGSVQPFLARAQDVGGTAGERTKAYTSGLVATGKVVGPDSKPQPGVPVEVSGPAGKVFTVTDSTGTWYLYNSPPGDYTAQPAQGVMTTPNRPVSTFKVEKTGLFEQLTGTNKKPTYAAVLMIDRDFKQ